jgi:hypothetical protein
MSDFRVILNCILRDYTIDTSLNPVFATIDMPRQGTFHQVIQDCRTVAWRRSNDTFKDLDSPPHTISIEEAISAVSAVLEEDPTIRTNQVGPTHGISTLAANRTHRMSNLIWSRSADVSNISVDGKELHREVDRSHWMHLVLYVRRYGLNISRAKDDIDLRIRRCREA